MNPTRTFLALTTTAAVLVAGAVFARSTPAASTALTAGGSSVAVGPSSFGRILFDGRGFALYAFTRDTRRRATCYGACAKAWPPYIVRTRPSAGRGATASLVGVTRRADGRLQATYAGRPLYYYVGDTKPGIVLCQNVKEFGGLWLVIRAGGTLVR
jgi:predicted lipoprotein with Yx(FWY)xxD motif